jgi:hypothetical protein
MIRHRAFAVVGPPLATAPRARIRRGTISIYDEAEANRSADIHDANTRDIIGKRSKFDEVAVVGGRCPRGAIKSYV